MRYFITTFGCQANEADAEKIETRLRSLGHKKAPDSRGANLIIINCCSIRQSAIDRVYAKVRQHKGKKIILAGCLLEADKKKLRSKVNEIWSPGEYFNLPPVYSDKTSASIPIIFGCNNFCTYCAVPYTRGREFSRPAKEIIKEVKKLVKNGYKEIWLLGQNVNSYKSREINFAKLLKKINILPGNFKIHFLSPHPKDFSDELIKVMTKGGKITRYINLPIQSGDNKILYQMNRGYTREHYFKLVKKIRKAMPDIKISTDIIVGFPGENKKQFQNTVDLAKEIGFDKAYVSRYSPRPGTFSARTMKDNISCQEKKRRWNILNELINNPSTRLRARKQKIIVVLGPTASGKSDLAVELARKFNGEVISADSRQVYKGLDIGSGKITKKEMRSIKHHLLDVASPKKIFTAMDFKKMAEKAIKQILQKNKIPIICGGTGFYIHTLLGGREIPEVAPNWALRKRLEKKTVEELFKMLKKLNSKRAENIDSKNKRRLIRAIEIAKSIPRELVRSDLTSWNVLWLGIKRNDKNLKELIKKRLLKRLRQGMIAEVKKLHQNGVSWKRLDDLGLEYGYVSNYLRNKISKEEMIEQLNTAIVQYSKRQMTWFKKYAPKTHWVKNQKESFALTKKFISTG